MLTQFKNAALAAIVGLGLAACSQVYDEAKMSAASGDAYSQALYQEMMKIANFERAEEDWPDANYHGGRALTVANGGSIQPTDPNARGLNIHGNGGIPKTQQQAALASLNGVLSDGSVQRDPANVAKAFAGYECMLEQSEEGHQAADIAACKKQFDDAIAALTQQPEVTATGPWTVFFPIDGDTVDAAGREVTLRAAEAAAAGGTLIVQGHADTLGPDDYNLQLSKRRAQSVVEILNNAGISTDSMTVGAVGESELIVQTPDETAEQENRVVVMRLVQ